MEAKPGQPTETTPPTVPGHELLKCIGRGGYGQVWLARNTRGEYRAVKIVYRQSFDNPKPFDREWKGIRRFKPISLSHVGFIDVLEVGMAEQEEYFYCVMEVGDDQSTGQTIDPDTYVPKTLSQEINRHGRLPVSRCVHIGMALCEALHELHLKGYVHRDIKPSNIIFVNDEPKLADIGLVTEANEKCSFVGTEGFVPPEGPGQPQADIYALGKVLYQACTGRDRNSFPSATTVLAGPDGKQFAELRQVLELACHSSVLTRYANAEHFQRDLALLSRGRSIKRRRLVELWRSRLQRVAKASAVAVLVLILAIGYFVYNRQRAATDALRTSAEANIAAGIRTMDSGDFLGALPQLIDGLRKDPGDSQRTSAQRLRLGTVLAQGPKLTHLWLGGGPASGCQFSPDGSQVLLARFCGDIEVHNLTNGRQTVLKPPPTLVNAAYSPDGRLLVTVSQSSVACIWNAANLDEVHRFPHASQLWDARFSPDGLRLVTAASDGVGRVWDIKNGRLVLELKKHSDAVHFCDFSHDGNLIVTASHDNTAQLWNARNGQPVGEPLKHGAWVTYAAFSPDDQKVVTSSLDRKARVWEISTGQHLVPDLDHRDGVQSAVFSPDGRFILTAGADGSARLWRAEDRQPVNANPVLRHPKGLTRASFGPDGHRILTTSADGSARVWDLAGSAAIPLPRRQPLSGDGSRFLTLTTNQVQVWDTRSAQPVGSPFNGDGLVERAALSEDGRYFFAICAGGASSTNHSLTVWDIDKRQSVGSGISLFNIPATIILPNQGDSLAIVDGSHVLIWNVATGSPRSPALPHKQAVAQALFSPDGSKLATVSGNEVWVWDTRSGEALFAPLTQSLPIRVAKFSYDARFLALGCSDNLLAAGYAQVYETAKGHAVGPRLSHTAGVHSLAFSRDNRRIVTASADFTAMVWEVLTGRRLTPPLQHENQVHDCSFSRNGLLVVTASADKTARVWEAQTGAPLTPPLRCPSPQERAGFLGDQPQVITVDSQGSARVWTLTTEARPIATLISLTRLLSSGPLDDTVSAANEPLETLWHRFRAQCPEFFAVRAENVTAWHKLAAQESELQGQQDAVMFHLRYLRSLGSEDLSPGKPPNRVSERPRQGN